MLNFLFICKRTKSYKALIFAVAFSIICNFVFDPTARVLHARIHSELAGLGAAVTPASHAVQVESTPNRAHHWSPGVSLAWVNPPLREASADHGVVNFPWVSFVAAALRYNWNGSLLKDLWLIPARRQSSPTCDPARCAFRSVRNRVR